MISRSGDRPVNEDSARVIKAGDTMCFVLADGLGGHGKGEVASGLAVTAFESVFCQNSGGDLKQLLAMGFEKAQQDILAEQAKTGRSHQMKTTVCVLAVRGKELAWGHIGDSRLYGFAHRRVKSCTPDHSVPYMLVKAKTIKLKDIRNHPDRNKLLRVLGNGGEAPKFEINAGRRLGGYQQFLLCSDGFWELITEKDMCRLLRESDHVQGWLDTMTALVEQNGTEKDMENFSAIAVTLK